MVYEGWRKEVKDKRRAPVLGEAVVVTEFVFEIGEEALEQVGGVGDLEGGVSQAGEEPREVSLEAQECGAKASVGVAGAARRW